MTEPRKCKCPTVQGGRFHDIGCPEDPLLHVDPSVTEPRKPTIEEDNIIRGALVVLEKLDPGGWAAQLGYKSLDRIVAKLREAEQDIAFRHKTVMRLQGELTEVKEAFIEVNDKLVNATKTLREAEREIQEYRDALIYDKNARREAGMESPADRRLREAEQERDEALDRKRETERKNEILREEWFGRYKIREEIERADKAEARAGRLEEALRPFAEAAELILSSKKAPIETDAELVVIPDTGACDFTMADLIRARDALLEARREKSLPEEPFGDSRPPTKGELDELHRAVRKQQARREET